MLQILKNMLWITKNKHMFSRLFVYSSDQPLAGFYPAFGKPTACLTSKKKDAIQLVRHD